MTPIEPLPPRRPDGRFLWAHPAHVMALGFGSGLSPKAPGTAGTLWAWAVYALALGQLTDVQWALLLAAGTLLGWWASALTARHLGVQDPGSIVWDEIIAFWLVLWLISPAGWVEQLAAFALFRFFDAVKPGPVRWADQLYHGVDPRTDPWAWHKAGWGILLDDLVAAFCTLLVLALGRHW